jgi:hypothetical protein
VHFHNQDTADPGRTISFAMNRSNLFLNSKKFLQSLPPIFWSGSDLDPSIDDALVKTIAPPFYRLIQSAQHEPSRG